VLEPLLELELEVLVVLAVLLVLLVEELRAELEEWEREPEMLEFKWGRPLFVLSLSLSLSLLFLPPSPPHFTNPLPTFFFFSLLFPPILSDRQRSHSSRSHLRSQRRSLHRRCWSFRWSVCRYSARSSSPFRFGWSSARWCCCSTVGNGIGIKGLG